MCSSFSHIGHGLTPYAAIDSAIAYLCGRGYLIKQVAETCDVVKGGDAIRMFFFIDGCYWYECTLEQTRPPIPGPPATYEASFYYFARTDEELRAKLGYPSLFIKPWKLDGK